MVAAYCSQAVWHIPLLCVQWKTPDDGQRNCPKHVEFYFRNKFEKLVHLVSFTIRVYHDARSSECQVRLGHPHFTWFISYFIPLLIQLHYHCHSTLVVVYIYCYDPKYFRSTELFPRKPHLPVPQCNSHGLIKVLCSFPNQNTLCISSTFFDSWGTTEKKKISPLCNEWYLFFF